MLVASLSSIPPRFGAISLTLESLLGQSARPDRVILWIPQAYRRFADWDGSLPAVPEGVEIARTEDDLGPATKILPATRAFRGQDVDLLLCDDDRAYAPEWAAEFLAAKHDHPGCAIAKRGLLADRIAGTASARALQPRALPRTESEDWEYRAKRLWARITAQPRPERRLFKQSGYIDCFEGCSGVLLRPEFFDDADFDIPEVAWAVDDVWLSACLARKGVPIWLIANTVTPLNTAAQAQAPLADAVIAGAGRGQANRDAIRAMQDRFGIWLD